MANDWAEIGFMYVTRQACGCPTGAIVEFEGRWRKFTAECVRDAIMGGYAIERVVNAELKVGPCTCVPAPTARGEE